MWITLNDVDILLTSKGFKYDADEEANGVIFNVTYIGNATQSILIEVEYDKEYENNILGEYIPDFNKIYVTSILFYGTILYESAEGIYLDSFNEEQLKRAIELYTNPVKYCNELMAMYLNYYRFYNDEIFPVLSVYDFFNYSSLVFDSTILDSNIGFTVSHYNEVEALIFYVDLITFEFVCKIRATCETIVVKDALSFTRELKNAIKNRPEYEYIFSYDPKYTKYSFRAISKLIAVNKLLKQNPDCKIVASLEDIPLKYEYLIADYNRLRKKSC